MTDVDNTLLIDGHDVRTLPGVVVAGPLDLFAPGDRRGNDDVIPNRQGELGAALPLAKFIVRIPIRVNGDTPDEFVANVLGLGPLIGGLAAGGLVTLTRHIVTASGFVEHTAKGRFITGLALGMGNPWTGTTELQYYNLDAAWWDPTTSAWLVP